jgi:hypothetical protein
MVASPLLYSRLRLVRPLPSRLSKENLAALIIAALHHLRRQGISVLRKT